MEAPKGLSAERAAPRRAVLPGEELVRAKAEVAARIAETLAARGLTMRAAAAEVGLDPADVQRIRGGELGRFSLDRLLHVAVRLGHGIELRLVPPGPAT